MALKVHSITFVKESDVPTTVKNTEMSQVVETIAQELVKRGGKLPAGQALSFKIDGAKKHTRFGLQSRLQKRGLKVKVLQSKEGFHVVSAS